MKKLLFALGTSVLLASSVSAEPKSVFDQAKTYSYGLGCTDCFPFVAPSIVGTGSINNPEIGAIVYDTTDDKFKGYDATGGWQNVGDKNFHVRGNITGTIQQLFGTLSSGGYIGIEQPDYSMNLDSGSARIPCSGTTAATGTECSGVNESLGVEIDVTSPGHYRACFHINYEYSTIIAGNSGEVIATFQIVQTGNTDQSIVASGGPRGIISGDNASNATSLGGGSMRFCGDFDFATTGPKTIRLFWDYDVSAVGSTFRLGSAQTGADNNIYFTVDRIGSL